VALASSALTDMDVTDLDEAISLFALRMVQKASMAELPTLWKRHSRYWKRRIAKEAYEIVAQTYQQRMDRAL
jgi:hypothetical protein